MLEDQSLDRKAALDCTPEELEKRILGVKTTNREIMVPLLQEIIDGQKAILQELRKSNRGRPLQNWQRKSELRKLRIPAPRKGQAQ